MPGLERLSRQAGTEQDGALAQLGERVLCKHEVTGSIPVGSTMHRAITLDPGRPEVGRAGR